MMRIGTGFDVHAFGEGDLVGLELIGDLVPLIAFVVGQRTTSGRQVDLLQTKTDLVVTSLHLLECRSPTSHRRVGTSGHL